MTPQVWWVHAQLFDKPLYATSVAVLKRDEVVQELQEILDGGSAAEAIVLQLATLLDELKPAKD